MASDTLPGHRNRAKLKRWHKLALHCLNIGTLSFLIRSGILNHVRRGRQKKMWSRIWYMISYKSLCINKGEWLEGIY